MYVDNVCNNAMLILNSELTDLSEEAPEPELVKNDLRFRQSIAEKFLFQG